jgi:immune inhibitor A
MTCSHLAPGNSYEAGPTACVAHPDVMENIRQEIESQSILSAADARLATEAGMLEAPAISRPGFNDGTIYEAGDVAMAGAAQPTAAFALPAPAGPTTLNCLVLLVDFSDNHGAQTAAHFQSLLFDPANPDSMANFYKELSYGALNVTGVVTNWIRVSHPYAYYVGANSGMSLNYPKNTPGLLNEALTLYCNANPNGLQPFDVNGDHYVDGLFLVHAGPGAEADPTPAGRAAKIWSHKWTLPTAFVNHGVKAYAYFTAPEDGRLGVFSHEFGHFLGLPDLYDTTYRSRGIGNWCLMAGGSWNGGGLRPARMSAWCLEKLGWITPTNVTTPGALTLRTLEADRTACYRLWTGGGASNEYFLIENRQKAGRDVDLPGAGLALWHIDLTQSGNTNPLAYQVALVQADGLRELEFNRNSGDAGDVYPGSHNVHAVNDTSPGHPHTRSNSGIGTGVTLSAITATGATVNLTVRV